MNVREVLEILADDEEMEHPLVHELEAAHDGVRARLTYVEADARLLVRPEHVRNGLEIEEVRAVIGCLGADERHAAHRTLVAVPAPDVRVHGAPVDRFSGWRRRRPLKDDTVTGSNCGRRNDHQDHRTAQ